MPDTVRLTCSERYRSVVVESGHRDTDSIPAETRRACKSLRVLRLCCAPVTDGRAPNVLVATEMRVARYIPLTTLPDGCPRALPVDTSHLTPMFALSPVVDCDGRLASSSLPGGANADPPQDFMCSDL